jgi:hypothetical protein
MGNLLLLEIFINKINNMNRKTNPAWGHYSSGRVPA